MARTYWDVYASDRTAAGANSAILRSKASEASTLHVTSVHPLRRMAAASLQLTGMSIRAIVFIN